MKKINLLLITFNIFNTSLKSQVTLPYYTGFNNATQLTGWVEYKKAATTFGHWGTNGGFISHDYSPGSGVTLTDNWFVSPGFVIANGGKLDSVNYKFYGFYNPSVGDTVAIYLLNGSQDPILATSKQLLFDFRNTEYIADNIFRTKKNIILPASSGLSYIAFRYRNPSCTNRWMTVNFDNILISGNSSVALNELDDIGYKVNISPNPFSLLTTLATGNPLNDATITIYNSAGQEVKQIKNIKGETASLSSEKLSNGIYFISIKDGYKVFKMEKLIISDNVE